MSVIRDPLPDMPAQCLWRKQFTAFVIVEGDFYDMVILYTLSPEIPVKQYIQEIWLPAPTNPGYCFHQPVLLSVLQPLQVNIPSDSLHVASAKKCTILIFPCAFYIRQSRKCQQPHYEKLKQIAFFFVKLLCPDRTSPDS